MTEEQRERLKSLASDLRDDGEASLDYVGNSVTGQAELRDADAIDAALRRIERLEGLGRDWAALLRERELDGHHVTDIEWRLFNALENRD